MSSFCILYVSKLDNAKKEFYINQIQVLAKEYKRGVKFYINWCEPGLPIYENDMLIVNVLDSQTSDNCEMFLLPDGWYSNGVSAKSLFRDRVKFLEDTLFLFICNGDPVELYIGQSGIQPEEFLTITLRWNEVADYLTKTIGINGTDDGMHITVTL